MELKTLSLGDEQLLESFLLPRAESSMFLRANSLSAGLPDRGERLQGTYVAAMVGGEVVSVAAHFWNGMLVLQAPEPEALEGVARAAVLRSGRELCGLVGPRAQIESARRALGVEDRPTSLDSREILFLLDLVEARREGVVRAILFTDEENRPAIAAYEALGFRPIGDYGLVMFK